MSHCRPSEREVMEKQELKVVGRDVETRKVADLAPHSYANHVFGKPPKHEIEELAADMDAVGQRDPLDVSPDDKVLNGRTRLEAAILRGMKELRVIVHDLDEEGAKRFILEANLLRHHYDKLTVARVYQELKVLNQGDKGRAAKTGDGDLRDRLAKRFSISGRSLDRHVKMLNTPAEAQSLYRKGVLSDSVMLALVKLTAEQQKVVLGEIKKTKDVKQKNHLAKTVIAKYRKEKKKAEPATIKAENAVSGNTVVSKSDGAPQEPAPAVTADPAVEATGSGESQAELPEAVSPADRTEYEGSKIEDADDDFIRDWEPDDASVQEPVAVYRRVLEELPGTLDELVEQIDLIVGEAMDAAAAMKALGRMEESIKTLIEAEEAKAAALAAV